MANTNWTLAAKISFRFSCLLIVSFIVISGSPLPFTTLIIAPLAEGMRAFAPWFASNALHYNYDHTIQFTGSGDSSHSWISLLLFVIIAVIGAIIWSVMDRKRSNYNSCYYWLTVLIRYYLAFTLISYGVIKLMHAQMIPPGLNRLMQPLGDFSPMGLAWTYFGYSYAYNIFVGIVEVLAALLLFRRTYVLGALITMATSINIMTVNYFFDVPVKILSTVLFLLSLFLLLPHLRQLCKLFLLGKPAEALQVTKPKVARPWLNKAAMAFKIFFIGIFAYSQTQAIVSRSNEMQHYLKKSPLYGIYTIKHGNAARKSLPEDWSTIIFEYEGDATVRDRYYERKVETLLLDVDGKRLTLNHNTFDYAIQENGDILLTRLVDDQREEIRLTKRNPENFELMKRKFNWMQEYPYNR